VNIGLDGPNMDYSILEKELNAAIKLATKPCPGPVHINIEYDEPLYESIDHFSLDNIKWIEEKQEQSDKANYQKYVDRISSSEKVLLLCGQNLPNDALLDALEKLSDKEQVVVLTESTSNLTSDRFIPSIDQTLLTLESNFEKYSPDILITIGDAVISKIIKRVLRKQKMEHWQISDKGIFRDTYRALSEEIHDDPVEVLHQLSASTNNSNATYSNNWKERYDLSCKIYNEIKKDQPFSDLKAFDFIFSAFEDESDLHVANSSVIRYQQLFKQKKINTFCNRGTSGIDGCSSTALGFSMKNEQRTWLISGDVSFLYDSNAWWNNYNPDLKVILINNGGGGIFRIIPGPSKIPSFEEYIETQHQVNIELLCRAMNIKHFYAGDMKSLKVGFEKLDQSEGIALLEIKTPREINAEVLMNYFNRLKQEDH